jgi:hypothetical protein
MVEKISNVRFQTTGPEPTGDASERKAPDGAPGSGVRARVSRGSLGRSPGSVKANPPAGGMSSHRRRGIQLACGLAWIRPPDAAVKLCETRVFAEFVNQEIGPNVGDGDIAPVIADVEPPEGLVHIS